MSECTHPERDIDDEVVLNEDGELALTGAVFCRRCKTGLAITVVDCLHIAARFRNRLSANHPLLVLAQGAEEQLTAMSDQVRAYVLALTLDEWSKFWELAIETDIRPSHSG